MITQINKLKEIGIFKDFNWNNDIPDFNKKNIIFGYNGCGKTTLTNIFNLFSQIDKIEKDELFADIVNDKDISEIELVFDGKKVKYNKDLANEKIWIFNTGFITGHIYDGSSSNIKQFDSKVVTKEQLKNPEIKKIEVTITVKKDTFANFKTDKEKYENEFEKIKKKYQIDFNNKISNKRLTGWNLPSHATQIDLNKIDQELDGYYKKYELSQKQDEFANDIVEIEKIFIKSIKLDFENLTIAFLKSISETAREKVEQKIATLSEVQLKNYKSLSEWFEDGLQLLKRNDSSKFYKCPLCDSDIKLKINSLIGDYESYFNDEYKILIKDLNTQSEQIDIIKEILKDNIISIEKIKTFDSKYSYLIDTDKKINYEYSLETCEKELENLQKLISDKKENVSSKVQADSLLKNLKNLVNDYNVNFLKPIHEQKTLIFQELKNQTLNESVIADKIKNLIQQKGNYDFDTFDTGNLISVYWQNENNIKNIKDDLSKLERQLESSLAKLKNESKYVNFFLKRLGIFHFEINIDNTKPKENISILYESGCTKNKLKNSISESEKSALAFAYFLSKLQYEVIDNTTTKLSECIVILDDPVSSLDERRLYSTAFLINDLLKDAGQLFVISHNLIFLKYYGNILSGDDRNDYFLNVRNNLPLLQSLPKSLSNYKTAYFQKLDDILSYINNDIDYEQAKKSIPGCIRVVLETFLSFKLYILKQGSSTNKYLSPGLDKLIKTLSGHIGLFKKYEKVEDIDHENIISKLEFIKKTTDPQCHGSPQNIDEFNFIDEAELKLISRDALNIIKFFDNVHYNQIQNG
ncbi:MAG: AAA family ATPase [Candidatus Zhuqueibacterota bacterium]